MDSDDAELLRRYVRERSEVAFTALVQRHLDLVYSAALRQVGGDAHRAQDVAQLVFLSLAREAAQLARRPVLQSWLYTTTRNLAAKARRTEQRREAREQAFEIMNAHSRAELSETEWLQLRPMLDDAMHTLNERDREAVLLRFFVGQPLAQIAAKFGISEDAAQKRVQRALERLRDALARRGITSSAIALAHGLALQAVTAAPTGLAAAIAGPAFIGAASSGGAGALSLFSIMSVSKISIGLAGACAVAASVGLLLQHRTISRLQQAQTEFHSLEQRQQEHEAVVRELAEAQSTIAALQKTQAASQAELAKTRDELTALKKRAEAFRTRMLARNGTLSPDAPPVQGEMLPVGNGEHPGNATPVAAIRSAACAVAQGDVDMLAKVIGFDANARAALNTLFGGLSEESRAKYGTPEKMFATLMAGKLPQLSAVGLLAESPSGPDDEVLRMRMQHTTGRSVDESVRVHRAPQGWVVQLSANEVKDVGSALTATEPPPGIATK